MYLSEPDYVIDNSIDQTNNETKKEITSINGDKKTISGKTQISHYHVNMATMLQLGKWFDYLRENNLYDNTRIIIVSDHGRDVYLDDNMIFNNEDMLYYNALLLYKDFDSQELIIDDSFMTNADTPYLAVNEIINNPINPFTGKNIELVDKEGATFNIFGTRIFDVLENNANTFAKDDKWHSVQNNCLDVNNWKIIKDPNEQ